MTSDQDRITELEHEVARLRGLVDTLYRHLGLGQLAAASASTGPSAEIVDAIRAGQLIVAIKLYRAEHGVGLKEAKDAVEALARTL